MTQLTGQKCVACRADSPRVTNMEIAELSPQIPSWNFIDEDGVPKLENSYRFPDFVEALSFTNSIGELAEAEGHHPRIITEWRKVTVTWWTHKIRNLHRNDFIMAAKTDQIFSEIGHGS